MTFRTALLILFVGSAASATTVVAEQVDDGSATCADVHSDNAVDHTDWGAEAASDSEICPKVTGGARPVPLRSLREVARQCRNSRWGGLDEMIPDLWHDRCSRNAPNVDK